MRRKEWVIVILALAIVVAVVIGVTLYFLMQEGEVETASSDPSGNLLREVPMETEPVNLSGTRWNLARIEFDKEIKDVSDSPPVTIEFSNEGNYVKGQTGCNSYGGAYEIKGLAFRITSMEKTEAGCPTQELFEREQEFVRIMVDAREFAVDEDQLLIAAREGRALKFKPRIEGTATPVSKESVVPLIEGYGPMVEQATMDQRGNNLYVEIIIKQDAGEIEAERVLDHAIDVVDQWIEEADGWYNYNVRVFYPDGTESVSVAVDAVEMFRE